MQKCKPRVSLNQGKLSLFKYKFFVCLKNFMTFPPLHDFQKAS